MHTFCMAYNVRIGYSIHTLHETTKINFQFLNEKQTMVSLNDAQNCIKIKYAYRDVYIMKSIMRDYMYLI